VSSSSIGVKRDAILALTTFARGFHMHFAAAADDNFSFHVLMHIQNLPAHAIEHVMHPVTAHIKHMTHM
jgi:hypothetical protein